MSYVVHDGEKKSECENEILMNEYVNNSFWPKTSHGIYCACKDDMSEIAQQNHKNWS